jgi:PST family polysaccharide transporter
MATYARQAKAGFLWGLLGRTSTTVVAVGTSMVMARLLAPADFGIVAIATFFIQISQRLSNLGFNTALMRLPDIRKEHSASVFTINVALGVAGALILVASAPLFAAFYKSADAGRVIPIAGLTFAIGCLGTVPSALLARQLRFKTLVAIESLYGWLISAVSVVLALRGWGYWSMVCSLLVGATFDATLKFAVARWRPSLTFSRAAFMELWSFGAGLHLKRLLETVANTIDNMVLGRTLGLAPLGIYDKAFTTMNRAVTLVSSAGQVVSISVLGKIQDDDTRFRLAVRKVILGISMVGYPAFAVLAMMAYPLFVVMFGTQWVEGVVPFQLLCGAGILKILVSYVSSAVQAKGRVWGEVWRQATYIVLIVIAVTVGSWWGLAAASAGVLVATIVMAALMADLVTKISTISWRDVIVPQRTGVLCAVMIAAAIGATRLAISNVVAAPLGVGQQLAIESAVSGICFVLYFLVCPFEEGRQLFQETVRDVTPKFAKNLGFGTA